MGGKCPAISSALSGLPSLGSERGGYHITRFGHNMVGGHRYRRAHEPKPWNERWSHQDDFEPQYPMSHRVKDSAESLSMVSRPVRRLSLRPVAATNEVLARPTPTLFGDRLSA